MNCTTLAQNLAPVAGAARPCAHRYAWLGATAMVAGVDFSMDIQNVTKRSPRRLGRHST